MSYHRRYHQYVNVFHSVGTPAEKGEKSKEMDTRYSSMDIPNFGCDVVTK